MALLTSCAFREDLPTFVYTQKVKFKVPIFYTRVCSGRGTVEKYYSTGIYFILTPTNEELCPKEFIVPEKDITDDEH